MSEQTEQAAKTRAEVEYVEAARDLAETPRAIAAAESRIGEAHDRLTVLEKRLQSILLHTDEKRGDDPSLTAVAPTRSDVSAQVWAIESEAARLITRIADLTDLVDL